MVNIGRYNTLKVSRIVDFGAYLDAGDGKEILMPAKYCEESLSPGDEVSAFVYTDSEDRLIATTEHPFAMVGEFAYLQVVDVNKYGAFLDWGLEAKNLLVPFAEQRTKMHPGGIYLVYVYLDNTTHRVVASSKTEKFLGNVLPHYRRGDKVTALVTEHTPIGYRCIVDNLHRGMIYANETFSPVELEESIETYVKQVRPDGKIDLTLRTRSADRTNTLADRILSAIKANGGSIEVTDKSDPAKIEAMFGCSKRDFKQAIGHLYKSRLIALAEDRILIVTSD